MKPRVRMTIVADGEQTAPPSSANGRWHAVALLENTWTSDGRHFTNIGVREEALARGALPLMADDQTTEAHLGAKLIGVADTFEKRGDELHLWGPYLDAPDERAAYLIQLVRNGELPGFSADVEPFQFEYLFPVSSDTAAADDTGSGDAEDTTPADEGAREDIDGQEYAVMPMDMPRMRITEGQLMGGTAIPFPAFEGTWIEHEADVSLVAAAVFLRSGSGALGFMVPESAELTAAGATAVRDRPREADPARFDFPAIPPAEWFDVPEAPGPMPLTILDSGQVFGHLALWGECHIGIGGECVTPPRSMCNYARFHVGEIPVAPDGRRAVGHLTFATGHASTARGVDGPAALAHYDHTGAVAADIRASDGQFGIWTCGAMRSTLTVEQVREVMSAPPSGDWRRWGTDLEMVAALCVNVPGFNTRRDLVASAVELPTAVRVGKDGGLVAALILSHAAGMPRMRHTAGFDELTARRLLERVAASVGRSRADRLAAIRARVHGGK